MEPTPAAEQTPLDELLMTEPELWQDGPPHETFRRLRGECPVHFTERISSTRTRRATGR